MGKYRHCLKFKRTSSGVARCRVFQKGAGHPRMSSILACRKLRSQVHIRPGNKQCAGRRGRRK